MLHRTTQEDNFEYKQCCNTVLTLQCFVALKIAIADQSMYPCNMAYCSLRNEMERNEMERNEMEICSLRNENL